jgi:hypothetical protein
MTARLPARPKHTKHPPSRDVQDRQMEIYEGDVGRCGEMYGYKDRVHTHRVQTRGLAPTFFPPPFRLSAIRPFNLKP